MSCKADRIGCLGLIRTYILHGYARVVLIEHLHIKSLIETGYEYIVGDIVAVSLDPSVFP